jgi:hypothetical protein
MDRAIAFCTLLLIGLTGLLYKLTALLEPRNEQPASGANHADASAEAPGIGTSSQKLIHQRLRK